MKKIAPVIGTSFIRDLAVRCRIGCEAAERMATQPLIVNLVCETDLSAAAASDDRKDCIDYVELHRIVLAAAEKSRWRLLESLAHAIAREALELPRALAVTVDIRKPHKLPGCAAVGIALTLRKEAA